MGNVERPAFLRADDDTITAIDVKGAGNGAGQGNAAYTIDAAEKSSGAVLTQTISATASC